MCSLWMTEFLHFKKETKLQNVIGYLYIELVIYIMYIHS